MAQDWSFYALVYFCSAVDDLFGAVLHRHLDLEFTDMTQDEIKHGLLQVCKVEGWDGDFNIVGFHALCDKLKQLGAEEEREACAGLAERRMLTDENKNRKIGYDYACKVIAAAIRARGQA